MTPRTTSRIERMLQNIYLYIRFGQKVIKQAFDTLCFIILVISKQVVPSKERNRLQTVKYWLKYLAS